MATRKGSTSSKNKLMVAAIDFGTTYSGWAYSFDHDYKTDPTKVYCKNWCGGNQLSSKAPTTVLVNPNGRTLEAFGYEAENKYAELVDNGEYRTYFYFQHFKMLLYDNQNLNRTTVLEDDKGKKLPAIRVFAMVIRYLKKDLIEEAGKKVLSMLEDDEIQWVLTVPAIWDIRAKQFMRECAVKAGIRSSNLLIALEPEAASLYCKHVAIQKQKESEDAKATLSAFEPGARYMVVDAGGGTIDIIVHEVARDGRLEEIHAANGGDWGGKSVDKAFFAFLDSLLGKQVMQTFKNDHMDDNLDLQREFDVKKRGIAPSQTGKIKVKVPVSLSDTFKKVNGKTVMDKIKLDAELNGKVNFMADKVLIDSKVIKACFDQSTDAIVGHLKNILLQKEMKGTDTILMVGGYSESVMLFEAVRCAFPEKRVLLPADAGLSVLRGAVIYGHNNKDISARLSQYTYGFKRWKEYDERFHPKHRMIIKDGIEQVRGAFDILVPIGRKLVPETKSTKKVVRPQESQTGFSLKLFASKNPNPIFVDDPGCFSLGEIVVDCKDDDGNVGSSEVYLLFGGTEFAVNAVHTTTGKTTTAKFNFLD